MPGPHFMDLVIFGAGLLGVITLAIHLGHSLPKYTQYIQESNEHYAAGEQETNLGMGPTDESLETLFYVSFYDSSNLQILRFPVQIAQFVMCKFSESHNEKS